MENEIEVFRNYIKENGLKFTPERKAILEEVFETHEHFDAESLYRKLKNKDKDISIATIYRTLPLLIESGLVSEAMRCGDRIYYEHTFGHKPHAHMVCIKCGKIIEFQDDRIEKIKREICEKYDFKPEEFRFGIKGICKDCR